MGANAEARTQWAPFVRVVASIFPKEGKAKRGVTLDGWQVELFAVDRDTELHAARLRGVDDPHVFNAQPGMRRPDGFRAELFLVQGFRPDFLALELGPRSATLVWNEKGDLAEVEAVCQQLQELLAV